MPTPVKKTENMAKNLTDAERAARQQAESEVLPDRLEGVQLKKPRLMAGDKTAGRYWKLVLDRMDGLQILDDLDSDALGVYCSMLSRYERMSVQVKELSGAEPEDMDAKSLIKFVETISAMEGKLQALERNILQYAEKLGLTPSGRARLAAKRAEVAGEEDPNADLFG